jgi:hypothetical protein
MASIKSKMSAYWVTVELRNQANRYIHSNKVYDVECGKTLLAMADDIAANNLESAQLRFAALHPNIKSSLPFNVMELLDKAELHNKEQK